MKRITKIMIGLSVFGLLLVSLLTLFLLSSLQHLSIKGNTYYTKEEMKRILIRDRLDHNAIVLYIRLKYGKKIKAPFINELDVDLVGMNGLNIRVYEKDIMGAFPYMGEYVCFDKDGIMVGSITTKRKDVPVIQGIDYKKVVYNEEIDTEHSEIFKSILNLTQLIKKYKVFVNQIVFDKDRNVKLLQDDIQIYLGKRSHFDEQISNLPEILSKSKGMKGVLRMEDYSALNRRVIFEEKK